MTKQRIFIKARQITAGFLILCLLITFLPVNALATDVSYQAPSFTMDKLDGGTIDEDDLKGKITVLVFGEMNGTDSNCYYTQEAVAGLVSSVLADYGVQMIFADIDNHTYSQVVEFQQNFDAGKKGIYCYGQSCYNTLGSFLSPMGISSLMIPGVFLIDSNGVVRCYMDGYQSIDTICNVLNQLDSRIPTIPQVILRVTGKADYTSAGKVVEQTNIERGKEGVGTLTQDKKLTELAMQRAAEIAIYYSHTRPNGEKSLTLWKDSISSFAISGENIAFVTKGTPDSEGIVNAWMNSEGHRANILYEDYQSIGVGCYVTANCTYWVQIFCSDKAEETANQQGVKNAEYNVSALESCVNLSCSQNQIALETGKSVGLCVYNDNTAILNNTVVGKAELVYSCLSVSVTTEKILSYNESTGEIMGLSAGNGSISINVRTDGNVSAPTPIYQYYTVTGETIGGGGNDEGGNDDGGNDNEGDKTEKTFSDVPQNAYYAPAVKWAVAKNITNGTSQTTFSPEETCTRAQMVTFLWRALNCPEPDGNTNVFQDVPENAYYRKAVLWAAQNGITTGTDSTHFSPDEKVTRAQAVTFLYRAFGGTPVSIANPFTDVQTRQYYYNAVLWAYQNGITTGTEKNRFSPDSNLTRAQCVTFLYRTAAE